MSKEKDMEYIKGFSKITIPQICKDLKIDRSNVLNGRASAENTKKVKEEIIQRLAALNE